MIAEEAVRRRSYFIWEQEGRPHGKALEHWLRAHAELEREFESLIKTGDWTNYVMPLVSISQPPRKVTSRRIPAEYPRLAG